MPAWINNKMLHYDRVKVSERTDINKTSASKQCGICHYFYFLNKVFFFNKLFFRQMSAIDVMIFYWCKWALAILLF